MGNSHLSGPLIVPGGFIGPMTGNIAGDVTGNVTGNLTGNVVSSSVNIGSGGALTFVKLGSVAIDLASISAGAILEATVTITGAAAGDSVVMNPPATLAAGLGVVGCYVSAANTVKLRVFNSTGAPIDEASASWKYALAR